MKKVLDKIGMQEYNKDNKTKENQKEKTNPIQGGESNENLKYSDSISSV